MLTIKLTPLDADVDRVIKNGGDVGLEYYVGEEETDVSEEEKNRIRWKIDLNLLPYVFLSPLASAHRGRS